jgi:hypothetical protein
MPCLLLRHAGRSVSRQWMACCGRCCQPFRQHGEGVICPVIAPRSGRLFLFVAFAFGSMVALGEQGQGDIATQRDHARRLANPPDAALHHCHTWTQTIVASSNHRPGLRHAIAASPYMQAVYTLAYTPRLYKQAQIGHIVARSMHLSGPLRRAHQWPQACRIPRHPAGQQSTTPHHTASMGLPPERAFRNVPQVIHALSARPDAL